MGRVIRKILYVDVACQTFKILTFAIPNFVHLPPINIPILYKKHPILLKLGALYHHLLKIHPIYVNWVPSSVMKTPIAIPKSAKKHPKRQNTYTYTMSMWLPPRAFCIQAKMLPHTDIFSVT